MQELDPSMPLDERGEASRRHLERVDLGFDGFRRAPLISASVLPSPEDAPISSTVRTRGSAAVREITAAKASPLISAGMSPPLSAVLRFRDRSLSLIAAEHGAHHRGRLAVATRCNLRSVQTLMRRVRPVARVVGVGLTSIDVALS